MKLRIRRDLLVSLRDMLTFADKATNSHGGLGLEEFVEDELRLMATSYALAIIGEAASRIPRHTREQLAPELPWPRIVAMRNLLVHDYNRVSHAVVHRTVTESLPLLRATVAALIARLEGPEGDLPLEGAE